MMIESIESVNNIFDNWFERENELNEKYDFNVGIHERRLLKTSFIFGYYMGFENAIKKKRNENENDRIDG